MYNEVSKLYSKHKADANVVKITNLEEFDIFHGKYSFTLESDHSNYNGIESFGILMEQLSTNESAVESSKLIDWAEVAKDYQGVLITPYLEERRTRYWYNTWDCASGCIWDTTCMASIETTKYDTSEWGLTEE